MAIPRWCQDTAHTCFELAAWLIDYNTVRPHSAVGICHLMNMPKLSDPAMQRDGTLRSFGGFAPHPLHHRA